MAIIASMPVTAKHLAAAVTSIQSDLTSSTRHWEEVLSATDARLAAGIFASPRWRARAEKEREIAIAKLAKLAAGQRVTLTFEEV